MWVVHVRCEIFTYGKDNNPTIILHSHLNNKDVIMLEIGEEKYMVKSYDLKKAVDSCVLVKNYEEGQG